MKKKSGKREHDEMPSDVSGLKGWKRARRIVDVADVRLPAKRITINLDRDVIAHFKAEALRGGPPYQAAINQALRRQVQQTTGAAEPPGIDVVLRALEDPTVQGKIRDILATQDEETAPSNG